MYPFGYLLAYRVAGCKECGYGCVANEVTSLLKSKHGRVKLAQRQAIAAKIRAIPGILRIQADLRHFSFPTRNTAAIPQLEEPKKQTG